MSWRRTLKSLLESGGYQTQTQLVAALDAQGHSVSQGSVSRELSRIGARKLDGAYQLVTGSPVVPVTSARVAHGGALAVLHTHPAFASVLAQLVDDADLDGVLGTIAGDDTVFVALAEPSAAERLFDTLGVSRPQEP